MQGMHYRAIDEHGHVHLGFSQGTNMSELDQWMLQRGWKPLPATSLQRVGNALGVGPRPAKWTKMSAALFTLHLSQLLNAGVPLITAIEELIKVEPQRSVKSALQNLQDKVESGSELSDAMKGLPSLFGPDYVAIVRAGERSGKLAACLEQQATHLQWQFNLMQRLKTVLTYPLFALSCLILVFLFVLLYIVPAMQPLLSMSSVQLPLHTQVLLTLSEHSRQFGVPIAYGIGFVLLACFLLFNSNTKNRTSVQSTFQHFIQKRMLNSGYGQIVVSYSLARYARTVGLLYESGVELTEAMRISHALVKHGLLASQLELAYRDVLRGETVAKAMQMQACVPSLFVRMVSAGEKAGVMGVALRQCADQLQSNAKYSLDRAERLIGPVLLCVMGCLLLWVALSVLGPIYGSVARTSLML